MRRHLALLIPLPITLLDDPVKGSPEPVQLLALQQGDVAQCPHAVPQRLDAQPYGPFGLVVADGRREEAALLLVKDLAPHVVAEARLPVGRGVDDELVELLLPVRRCLPCARLIVWKTCV